MENYSKKFRLGEVEKQAKLEGKLDMTISEKVNQLNIEIEELEDRIKKLNNTTSVTTKTNMDRVNRLDALEKKLKLKNSEIIDLTQVN